MTKRLSQKDIRQQKISDKWKKTMEKRRQFARNTTRHRARLIQGLLSFIWRCSIFEIPRKYEQKSVGIPFIVYISPPTIFTFKISLPLLALNLFQQQKLTIWTPSSASEARWYSLMQKSTSRTGRDNKLTMPGRVKKEGVEVEIRTAVHLKRGTARECRRSDSAKQSCSPYTSLQCVLHISCFS